MTNDDVAPDLASELAALVDAPRYRPGPPCGVALLLRTMQKDNPAAAKMFEELIDNESVSAGALSETLGKHGTAPLPNSISRHRRRGRHNGCRCPR